MKKEEQLYERVVLILLLLGTAYLYFVAGQSKSVATGNDMASMDFPKAILAILGALCVVALGINISRGAKMKQKKFEGAVDKRTWMTAAAIIIYACLWEFIGFVLSSFIFFFAEAFILKRDVKKLQAAAVAIGTTIGIYVIFGVAFGVDFPEPILELLAG